MIKDYLVKLGLNSGLSYVTAGNLISAILSAVMWLVLASSLPTSEFGRINFFVAIGAIAGISSLVGLNITFINYISSESALLRRQGFLVVAITATAIAVGTYLYNNSVHISLFIIGTALFTISMSEILGRQAYKEYAIVSISQRALQLVLSIILGLIFGAEGVIAGFWISFILFSFRFFSTLQSITIQFSLIRKYWKFMLHSYSFELTRSLSLYSDKLLIAPLFGFTMLGFYQLGIHFLTLMGILPSIVFSYLLSKKSVDKSFEKLRFLSLALSGIFSLIFIAVSPFLISTFFSNFIDSITAIQIIGLGVIPMTLTSNFSSYLLKKEKSKIVFTASVIFLGLLYPQLVLLGNYFGIVGLSISMVTSLTAESIFLLCSFIKQTISR